MAKRKAAAVQKTLYAVADGPFAGHTLALAGDGDGATAWVRVGSKVGRYVAQRRNTFPSGRMTRPTLAWQEAA